MALKSKGSRKRVAEVDLRPDGWGRFEKAVDVAMKTPAKHRGAKGVVKPGKNKKAR